MKRIKNTYVLLFVIMTILSGCGGSSSNSGLGLSVGGSWSGTLFRNQLASANFTMSLSQVSENPVDPFSNQILLGTLNSNHNCIGGGTIAGIMVNNYINLTVTTANGSLNLSGQANNTNMSGSWTNTGTISDDTSETTTVVTDGTTTTTTTSTSPDETCNFGGTWSAHR